MFEVSEKPDYVPACIQLGVAHYERMQYCGALAAYSESRIT